MWHRYFTRFCGRFFYSAIPVRGTEHIPLRGPVLWLGLHRNGAVDGFVYAAALRRPLAFMISTQLRKNFFARVFFDGIAVTRTGDEGDRAANRAALAECVALLRRGGELFVFPEGTSSLGPRHLPFKAGAAQLVLDWLDGGNSPASLRVIPVGVHYECAWAFRSAVEVVVGEPIDISLPEGTGSLGRLRELKRRMSVGLEAVGVNFSDATVQRENEALANVAATTGGFLGSRFDLLKACERGEYARERAAWREFETTASQARARRYHDVPLMPAGAGAREVMVLLALGLPVIAGIVANALPWLGAEWAAKKFPDDANVIALWKILAGLPLLALWSSALVVALAIAGDWRWVLSYVALTWLAWAAYDRVKRDAVAVSNRIFRDSLRDPFARMRTRFAPAK